MKNLKLESNRLELTVVSFSTAGNIFPGVRDLRKTSGNFKSHKIGLPFLPILLTVILLTNINFISSGIEWKIFTSGYSYNKGSVNLSKVIKTRSITDIIKTKDGTIWLACADNYPIFIKGINTPEYTTGISNSKAFSSVKFVPSPTSKFSVLPNGDVWMVTAQNLLHLKNSGTEWEGYNTKSPNAKTESSIPVLDFDLFGDMAVDSLGNLWVSGVITKSNTCGLAKLDNSVWQYYMTPAEMISEITKKAKPSEEKGIKLLSGKDLLSEEQPDINLLFKNLTFDKSGNIWMSIGRYDNRELCEFSNGIFTLFSPEKGNFPSNKVADISSNKNGVIHVATEKGLILIGPGNNYLAFEPKIVPTKITFDSYNNLWWSPKHKLEPDTLLNRYNIGSKSSLNFTKNNSPLTNSVNKVYTDENNVKYFIISSDFKESSDGLYILEDQVENKFPNWQIKDYYICGYEYYLKYDISSGLNDADGNFYGIASDSRERSLNVYRNGSWESTNFRLANESTGLLSSGHIIQSVAKDKKGDLYLGTTNSIYKYDNLCSLIEGLDKKQISDDIGAMVTDKDGNIWIGSTKGLAKYDGSVFTYYNKKNLKLTNNWILSLLVDKNNKVWVGTPDGVVCFDGVNQTTYNKKTGMGQERVMAIAEDSKGKVYFGVTNFNSSAKSLYFIEDGVMKSEPLPDLLTLTNMVFDKMDNLWINCERSIVCRKNTGEYITYNEKNSPLLSSFNILHLFIVGNELWIDLETSRMPYSSTNFNSSGTSQPSSPPSKETVILNNIKTKIARFEPDNATYIFKLE